MIVKTTKFQGVLLVQPPTVHEDFRGSYLEVYNKKIYKEAGISVEFVQDDISVSYRNVLRGIHGDDRTWKLVSCSSGLIYHVVVDYQADSPTFLKWQSFILSADNHNQVLIPPQYGNGFLVISEVATFAYKQSSYYEGAGKQFTLNPFDPKLNIYWPTANAIMSERDRTAKLL